MHSGRRLTDAQRLNGGASVAGTDELAIDVLVIGLEDEVERLGLDILGHGGGGTSKDGDGGGDLHCEVLMWYKLAVCYVRGL